MLNKLEVFNESCIILATYHLLVFTDMVDDVEVQYKFGWSMIFITVVNIAVNMGIMAKESLKEIKKGFAKIKEWCKRKKAQKYEKNGKDE